MATVRRVGVDNVDAMRVVRLRALRDAPEAFGSTYEREASFAPEVWTRRLAVASNAHFLAADDAPVGIVAIVRDEPDSTAAWLVGMWVDPQHRGSGVAADLVATALEWARAEGIDTLRLHVADGNDRAEHLYLRHGFSRTGETEVRERDGVIEHEMRCDLRAP